ncbi:glutathione S-transferase [Fomitiporia mediterranea MF3/22]|uniref:glutathione S-transferase n=1 Tax=Fomitiporia mediterranea (strain MF3/22) TaxID=694068 RepID=UPI0004407A60|nr:glutathione S-transferase [Fomitiporia mediterranea MF3/22]EJD04216.1 glutathione S-transferase [Fomitiporia mediterranea MF3/22]
MAPVKLYGAPMSTCTRRVATVLKEKGVPYELVLIDFSKAEHKSPDYVANLQPFGQVPVLKDGDFTLYESRAIGRYIAAKYANQGTPGLIPPQSNIEAWARFEEAASIEQNNFDPFASGISAEKVFKPMRGGQTDEKRVKELTDTLYAKLDAYEAILSKRKYLAGDSVTLADLFHLPYGTMITERLGIDALNSKPNIARWWKDITSRESWQAVKDGA